MSSEINHKKRILFIITQSDFGGAQRFLLNLLSRIGSHYDIRVALGSDGGNELTDKLKSLNIEISTLENLKRDISPVNDIKAVFEIKKLIENFKPDTLFLLSSKAGFIGSLATRYIDMSIYPRPRQSAAESRRNLRVIYRIGGWTFNDPWPKWKKKLWIKLEKLSASWKDVIIVNNRHDLEQARKLGITPRDTLILIHNGVDPYELEFLPRDEARLKLFEKLSRRSGKIFQADTIIGTMANLYPAKGIKFLIETAEYFKNTGNTVFMVIGDGPMKKELELSIKYYGLEKRVFLLGQLPDAYRFIPAFDIFILPSVKEGFPWALIEAMAAKLPVIATRVGAVPEIIENGKNGFIVEPANPAALAGKIKELIANDHLRQEFAIQGHQTILFNFPENKMIKEIETLL